MKKARIALSVLLILAVLVCVDFGLNFLKSTVPALNDGIGNFSIFRIPGVVEPFGDGGWSQAGYLAAFEKSVWVAFALFAARSILGIVDVAKKKDRAAH